MLLGAATAAVVVAVAVSALSTAVVTTTSARGHRCAAAATCSELMPAAALPRCVSSLTFARTRLGTPTRSRPARLARTAPRISTAWCAISTRRRRAEMWMTGAMWTSCTHQTPRRWVGWGAGWAQEVVCRCGAVSRCLAQLSPIYLLTPNLELSTHTHPTNPITNQRHHPTPPSKVTWKLKQRDMIGSKRTGSLPRGVGGGTGGAGGRGRGVGGRGSSGGLPELIKAANGRLRLAGKASPSKRGSPVKQSHTLNSHTSSSQVVLGRVGGGLGGLTRRSHNSSLPSPNPLPFPFPSSPPPPATPARSRPAQARHHHRGIRCFQSRCGCATWHVHR